MNETNEIDQIDQSNQTDQSNQIDQNSRSILMTNQSGAACSMLQKQLKELDEIFQETSLQIQAQLY